MKTAKSPSSKLDKSGKSDEKEKPAPERKSPMVPLEMNNGDSLDAKTKKKWEFKLSFFNLHNKQT